MPIPKPKDNEKKSEFISRCAKELVKADPQTPNKKRLAICYSQWDKKEDMRMDYKKMVFNEVFFSIHKALEKVGREVFDAESVYVRDFSPSEVVFSVWDGKENQLWKFTYSLVNGIVQLADDGEEVEEFTTYELDASGFVKLSQMEQELVDEE